MDCGYCWRTKCQGVTFSRWQNRVFHALLSQKPQWEQPSTHKDTFMKVKEFRNEIRTLMKRRNKNMLRGAIMAESLLLQGHGLGSAERYPPHTEEDAGCINHYPGTQGCTRLSNFFSRYSILSVCQLASCSFRYQTTLWDPELQFCTTIWLAIMTSGSRQIQAPGLSPRTQD